MSARKNIVDDLVSRIESEKHVKVSEYQRTIYEFIAHGKGNAVIDAKAGSGKTTTLINSLSLIPDKYKVLFVAFNKHIVNELTQRIGNRNNIDIKTVHSLGFSMLKRNFIDDKTEINEYKYKVYTKNEIQTLTDIESKQFINGEKDEYLNNINDLVNLGRLNMCQSERDFKNVAERYSISPIDDEINVALKVIEWGKTNHSTIDYIDMVWLPVELLLKPIGYQYDWIFVDELQDISDVQRELILKCAKRGTRIIGCGDPSQCIYSFSGSSPEAFKRFQELKNTITLPLSISYRCSKNIVKFANDIVPDLMAADNAINGTIEYDSHVSNINNGDMVLCRNKYPLFKLYMMFLKIGKKSYIKGNDLGDTFINMVKYCDKELLNKDLRQDGVFVRLYDKMFEDRNRLMLTKGLDISDATCSDFIMRQYDNIKALEALSDGINTSSELSDRICRVFSNDMDGICLSTIHKAKGLEADNVYIICKSLMPSKLAKLDWEIKQEKNLEYVAYTRAKKKLSFVSEKEVAPLFNMGDVNSVLTELGYIEKMVCKVLNKKPMTDMSDIEASKIAVSKMEPIKDIDAPTVILIDSSENIKSKEKSYFEKPLKKKRKK